MSRLDDFISSYRLEAKQLVRSAVRKRDDDLIDFIALDDGSLEDAKKWSEVDDSKLFWTLLKRHKFDVAVMVITSLLFCYNISKHETVPTFDTVVYAAFMLFLIVVIVLNLRLNYRFFKSNKFPISMVGDIRMAALEAVGIGNKFVYFTSVGKRKRLQTLGDVETNAISYRDIFKVELGQDNGVNVLTLYMKDSSKKEFKDLRSFEGAFNGINSKISTRE